jgi:UDP-4-amino-4,6-dideoxy-N-acetyl-beta-L-altrosamine transaminase
MGQQTGQAAGIPFLPYGRQSIDEDDVAAVAAVLRGDWLTQGPAVTAFETALARRLGVAEVVACANGTAALHLAALALDLNRAGEAVIVPAITFLATASAPHLAGATVVLADVDPATGLMGVTQAEAAMVRAVQAGLRVRALFPVHYAGQAADMAGLAALAKRHDAVVVEDACHALGTLVYDPVGGGSRRLTPVGACRHSACTVFSFHPVKTIAAGEGGAVAVADPALARRVRNLCNHGMARHPAVLEDPAAAYDADGTPAPWYYEMAAPGLNYRLSDIHCALGMSQLAKLDRFIGRRRRLMKRYAALLAPLAPLVRPLAPVPGCRAAWHLNVVQIDFAAAGRSRTAVMTALRAEGIGTQVHYIPLHRQPFWRRRWPDLRLPGAEAFYAGALSLPLFPAMTDGDVDRVVAALVRALRACQ